MGLSTDLFDYNLPEQLIAQFPADRRDGSRMMVLDHVSGETQIMPFPAIRDFLNPGDAMICNDTKVMACRLYGRKEGRPDGAKFEALQIEMIPGSRGAEWKAMLKPGKRAKDGTRVVLLDLNGNMSQYSFTVRRKFDDGTFEIQLSSDDYLAIQTCCGHLPLPPYIRREADQQDANRYQTVFAHYYGAVAAPTAGLHFTNEILQDLDRKGVKRAMVTLHVGPGTFQPVSVSDVSMHKMHTEAYVLPDETARLIANTRKAGKKVLAVGTTTVRVLESCADEHGVLTPGSGTTDIFIYPPYKPKAVDMLLTNFHLPKSTLLMLVSAFASREIILEAYAKAVREKMRFYSYGDCMLII